jgi:hypothetical protein
MKQDNQVTGNVGLYYVCYHLSRLGWNAMPTSRNAKGIDILAFRMDGTNTKTIRVIVYNVGGNDEPAIYVMTPDEVRKRAHRGEKDGIISFWLQPKSYECREFTNAWNRINVITESAATSEDQHG